MKVTFSSREIHPVLLAVFWMLICFLLYCFVEMRNYSEFVDTFGCAPPESPEQYEVARKKVADHLADLHFELLKQQNAMNEANSKLADASVQKSSREALDIMLVWYQRRDAASDAIVRERRVFGRACIAAQTAGFTSEVDFYMGR